MTSETVDKKVISELGDINKKLFDRQIYITALILSSGYMGKKFTKLEMRSDELFETEDFAVSKDDIDMYTNFWKKLNSKDLELFIFNWMTQLSSLKKFPLKIPNVESEERKFFDWMLEKAKLMKFPKKVVFNE